MTKKGGKSTRQINSHECPSELCLWFSPEKQLRPSARLQDRAGKRGRAGEKQPRQSRGCLSLVQARGQPPRVSWGCVQLGTSVLQEASLLPSLFDGGACGHPSRNVGEENPPVIALSHPQGTGMSPAGAVTFRMDRATFASIFPLFPMGSWLPLLFLSVAPQLGLRAGGKWPSHPQCVTVHVPKQGQTGSAGTRGCGHTWHLQRVLFAFIAHLGTQPDPVLTPLEVEG